MAHHSSKLTTAAAATLVLVSLSSLPTAAAWNYTGYSDRTCQTEAIDIQSFQNGCLQLPAGIQSAIFDTQGFESAYLYFKHYLSADCTGAYFGVGQEVSADYPVPDAACVNAQPVNATFGSVYFSTYR